MNEPLRHEALTFSVIGGFFAVYNYLGFGLPEHLYMRALEIELRERGHHVGREVYVPVFYHEHELGRMRLDMVVDETLVVEGKAGIDLHRGART